MDNNQFVDKGYVDGAIVSSNPTAIRKDLTKIQTNTLNINT